MRETRVARLDLGGVPGPTMQFRFPALALLGALAPSTFAISLVHESFDSGFTTGNLNGQAGYSTDVTGSNFRYAPNQGLTGGGVTVNTRLQLGTGYAYQDLGYSPTASHPLITASVDVASLGFGILPPKTKTSRFGLSVFNGSGDVIAQMAFRFTGGQTTQSNLNLYAGDGFATSIDTTGGFNEWKKLTIALDTKHNIAAFLLDDTLVGLHRYTADDSTIGDVDLYDNATGYDTGAYDNLRVNALALPAPVPEPASLAALGLGLVAVARRRRRG